LAHIFIVPALLLAKLLIFLAIFLLFANLFIFPLFVVRIFSFPPNFYLFFGQNLYYRSNSHFITRKITFNSGGGSDESFDEVDKALEEEDDIEDADNGDDDDDDSGNTRFILSRFSRPIEIIGLGR